MKDYSILLRGGGVTVEIAPEGELCLLENGTEGFGRVDGVVTLAEYAVSGGGYPVSRHVSRREIVLTAEVRAAVGTAAFTDLRATPSAPDGSADGRDADGGTWGRESGGSS